MPTSNRTVGITLVVIGLLILLGQMGVDFFGWLWPLLLCGIGCILLWSWYTRSDDSGKVFSGVLLILLAFFFLFVRSEHVDMIHHWPFFVLAPGIGLLVMSRVDRSRRDASVPGWIAIGIAAVLYFFTSGLFMGLMGFLFGLIGLVLRLLVPLALVGLGGWMLMNSRNGRRDPVPPVLPEKFEPPAEPKSVDDEPIDPEPGPESPPEPDPDAAAGSTVDPVEEESSGSFEERFIEEAEIEEISDEDPGDASDEDDPYRG